MCANLPTEVYHNHLGRSLDTTPFEAKHLIRLAQSQKKLQKLTLSILDPDIKYPIDMIKPMLTYADQLTEIIIINRRDVQNLFNEKDFEEILKVVERRHNSIKLNINITTETYFNEEWKKEKMIIFNGKSNRLNVISHYVMSRSSY